MNIKPFSIRTLSLGIALVSGIVVGTFCFHNTVAVSNPSLGSTPKYLKNKSGETYGSAMYAPPDNYPDLVQAVGVDGTPGYVRNVDLRGKKPRNPEEALAHQRGMAGKDRPIPLYDVDGKK